MVEGSGQNPYHSESLAMDWIIERVQDTCRRTPSQVRCLWAMAIFCAGAAGKNNVLSL